MTYVGTMPVLGPGGQSPQEFELERVDYMSPDARGRVGGVTAGFPLWRATWQLGRPLPLALTDQWRAFITQQRGQQRLFVGRDYARGLPKAYPNGLPPGFSGAATGWGQTPDSDGTVRLALSGLPVGLVISQGDYIDFRWSTYRRAMVRALESYVADSSGNAYFMIEPAVPSIVPSGAQANLNNPACLMRLLPDTKLGSIDRMGRLIGAQISAIQDLIP